MSAEITRFYSGRALRLFIVCLVSAAVIVGLAAYDYFVLGLKPHDESAPRLGGYFLIRSVLLFGCSLMLTATVWGCVVLTTFTRWLRLVLNVTPFPTKRSLMKANTQPKPKRLRWLSFLKGKYVTTSNSIRPRTRLHLRCGRTPVLLPTTVRLLVDAH